MRKRVRKRGEESEKERGRGGTAMCNMVCQVSCDVRCTGKETVSSQTDNPLQ